MTYELTPVDDYMTPTLGGWMVGDKRFKTLGGALNYAHTQTDCTIIRMKHFVDDSYGTYSKRVGYLGRCKSHIEIRTSWNRLFGNHFKTWGTGAEYHQTPVHHTKEDALFDAAFKYNDNVGVK